MFSLKRDLRSAHSLSLVSVKVGKPSTQPSKGSTGADSVAFQASGILLW